ncbi:MAG: Gp138 family membrane-puncturing spike protein [Vibrio sp.]
MGEDEIIELIRSELMEINTGIPAEIVSYAGGLASVKPSGKQLFKDGREIEYPVIHNCPVQWPRFNGGKAGFKGKVSVGDGCWLSFSQRSMDSFLSGSGDDTRSFDLNDCVVQMGVYSGTRSKWEENNDSAVMYFGDAAVQITESGEIHMHGTKIFHHAPVTGDSTATYTGEVQGNGVKTSSHVHSGVQSGSSNTGNPVK